MIRTLTAAIAATTLLAVPTALSAQSTPKPAPRTAPRQPRSVQVGGFALFGNVDFTATQSFDTIVGKHAGPLLGGGARVGLPWGGLFAEVGAWRFHARGERVFLSQGTRYPLGITDTINVTPIEISAGWQFRIRRLRSFTPYVAGGYTSLRYQESSDFSASGEDVDQNFGGYHFRAGAEYKVIRWIGVAAEVQATSVPNAIGQGGVSKTFAESSLGGRQLRLKITIGR